jgi:hypothetical protein
LTRPKVLNGVRRGPGSSLVPAAGDRMKFGGGERHTARRSRCQQSVDGIRGVVRARQPRAEQLRDHPGQETGFRPSEPRMRPTPNKLQKSSGMRAGSFRSTVEPTPDGGSGAVTATGCNVGSTLIRQTDSRRKCQLDRAPHVHPASANTGRTQHSGPRTQRLQPSGSAVASRSQREGKGFESVADVGEFDAAEPQRCPLGRHNLTR